MKLTWEEIENRRDLTFHRTRTLQVKTEEEALEFVNDVGFCFAFAAKNSELPCLWHAVCGERNPQMPEHIQHDWAIGLVWSAKDSLAAEKKLYYGKALKHRPTMISLEYFPDFYSLTGLKGDRDAYVAQYMRGDFSPAAKRIMDALVEQSPQVTRDLKLTSGYSHPKKRYEFDRAMAELQMKMYVVKIAEIYEPFTFVWELVVKRFADEIDLAKELTPPEARIGILKKYFQTVLVSNATQIQRLFGWDRRDISAALAQLSIEGTVGEVEIDGERNDWLMSRNW